MARYRQDRVNDAVKQEMAQILRDDKDPRIAGSLVSITAAQTLYAHWSVGGLVYIDNGTSIDAYQAYIEDGSSFDMYAPDIDNGSGWDLYS